MPFTVNPTPTELLAFRRSVRRRRASAFVIIAVSAGVVILLYARGLPGWWFAIVWGIAAIACVAVWRCPRCGKILDRNLMARECSNCYLRFDAPAR